MSQWKVADVDIFMRKLELVGHLRNIHQSAEEVPVAKHNSLWVATRARSITNGEYWIKRVILLIDYWVSLLPVHLDQLMVLNDGHLVCICEFPELFRHVLVKGDHLLEEYLLATEELENIFEAYIRTKESSHLCLVKNRLQHFISKGFVQWHRSHVDQVARKVSHQPFFSIHRADTNQWQIYHKFLVGNFVSQTIFLDSTSQNLRVSIDLVVSFPLVFEVAWSFNLNLSS